MHILAVHNYYQQPGGEDLAFRAEASLLEKYGHQVDTYSVHNNELIGTHPIVLAGTSVWNQTKYRQLRELIREKQPDIVHFHNTLPLISPAAYYAAKSEGKIVIQTLHNYRLLCPNGEFFRQQQVCELCLNKAIPLPGIIHACYRENRMATVAVAGMLTVHRALRTWSNMVDRYITLTEFARQKFIEGGIPGSKILVKPNFVESDPNCGTGRGKYAIFVGRLAPEKGLETVLSAWQQLGHILPLKIVGNGPLAQRVEDASKQLSGITWLGHKSLSDVYDLVGEATCLIFPSEWYETFGRVVIEAFAKGTPVVASKIGAIAELISHAQNGLLFQPGDPDDLVKQITWLLAHPEHQTKMRQQARAEFEAKYTAEKNYQLLIDIYQSL